MLKFLSENAFFFFFPDYVLEFMKMQNIFLPILSPESIVK